MITLDPWHLAILAIMFIAALFHMYWTGFRKGVAKTAELLGEDSVARAFKFLEAQGIIRIEVEDGEEIIYPGESLVEDMSEKEMQRALKYLESINVIKIEIDSDGEEIITSVPQDDWK